RLSHAYGLQANSAFKITAACDASAENRERAKQELGCAVYQTHQELLAAEALDLVSVVTRSDTHASIACDCLRAGVHTVVTKPWALDSAEAETMIAAQKESGCHLFPWIPMYWSPDYRIIRSLLDQQAIGDVFLIRRNYSYFRRRHDWQTQLRYGGGYLLNWGMHIIQPVIGLAGSPVKSVFGQLLQTIDPGDAEDNFLAVMEFANGIRGIAEFTQSLFPLPFFLIQGTRGSILADMASVILKTMDPDDPDSLQEEIIPLEGKIFGDEADIYRDIAATLLGGADFPVSPAMAMEGTGILEAVRRSHELGHPVTVPV
ncbi:MAG TPA: Gfo/Idh/MocA family oxidoreductase, partial [Oceanipulchritudo sp.]|nr:Gfo/Idh/MocA family oxidoreductase [Oceanipulchritudo sp.]